MATEWVQAPYNPLRVFTPRGKAITVHGTNRHTGQPVNIYGLTKEAHALQQAILAAHPDSPTRNNFAVDRNQNGSSNLSDHARGEALDIMIQRYDGNRYDRSQADLDFGNRLFTWISDTMRDGTTGVGPRGKRWAGPYRVAYVLFDGRIHAAGEAGPRAMRGSGDPHRDHIHISIVPVDRVGQPVPPGEQPTDPRRTLRLRWPKMRGADVELVQRVTGAKVDPTWGKGVFGEVTDRAVRDFQRRHGLTVDGVVGPQTWGKIDEVAAA